MQFKVGDRVKVTNYQHGYRVDIDWYNGVTGTITEIDTVNVYPVVIELDEIITYGEENNPCPTSSLLLYFEEIEHV